MSRVPKSDAGPRIRLGRYVVGGILAAAVAVAGCASGSGSGSGSAGTVPAASAATDGVSSLATSLVTNGDSWAIVPVSSDPAYWQVLSRPTGSATWRLVTPPGVADNGGLVAAPTNGGNSLTIGVLPSKDLTFSPLAVTADGGAVWTTAGPVSAPIAASPDALAARNSDLAALLGNGTIVLGQGGSTWQTLAKPGTIAASPAGKGCGTVRISSLSFGPGNAVIAGGSCGTGGTGAEFSYTPAAGWQRVHLPVLGQLVRYTDGMKLVRTKAGLTVLWGGFGWYAYAPLSGTPSPSPSASNWVTSAPLPVSGSVVATGTLAGVGGWVLLPGGRAATISALSITARAPQWVLLPRVPQGTSVLASGPSGATDALAVWGATVTVWRLEPRATVWSKVQTINVPIQYGSSS